MITKTDELIEFLNEKLDWPVEKDEMEYLTYEWETEELGINSDYLKEINFDVKIQQLKPLVNGQPWGLFFLKFEGLKNIPISFLRKVLNSFARKKSSWATSSERMTWDVQDLMFINSVTSDGKQRQIFAHFNEREKGIHQLKTFSWDNQESEEHFENIYEHNLSKLQWPEDTKDLESWRSKWSSAFTTPHRYVITTSKQLSEELARFAANIKEVIPEIYELENDEGPMHHLFKSFREVLIKDLKVDGFADMVAQTITYGLFSACATGAKIKGIETLEDELPNTNPFLKQLFAEFSRLAGVEGNELDFDDLKVSRIVDMLNGTNMDAILTDFGRQTGSGMEDPIIHFYETFLKAYDSQQKVQRGVFYTPKPVVSFIIRSVDEQLRTEFGLEDGLADTTTWREMVKRNSDIKIPKGTSPDQAFVQILDPATGTGTFLVETIALIHKTMIEKWSAAGESDKNIEKLWNDYVPKHLLTRIYGYELLMAPYAVAHLKIGLALSQTGYWFKENQRLQIYLTNSLEPPAPLAKWIPDFLAHETQAVNSIKENQRFTVVIGNPPYLGESKNKGDWIMKLMEVYKKEPGSIGKLKERNPKWINDDYVKFIRHGQYILDESMNGILTFINPHGFLDNPTFRGMRWTLLKNNDKIYTIDLHGNTKKREKAPDGSIDKNVFDIQQGVSINSLIKKPSKNNVELGDVFHYDVFGTREHKYGMLSKRSINSINFKKIDYRANMFFMVPKDFKIETEYICGFRLSELFLIHGVGITTAHDNFVIKREESELLKMFKEFQSTERDAEKLHQKFDVRKKKGWDILRGYDNIKNKKDLSKFIKKISYRLFDDRFIFYEDKLVWRTVRRVMDHYSEENIGLMLCKQFKASDNYQHCFLTKNIYESSLVSNKTSEIGSSFPLYSYNQRPFLNEKSSASKRIPNFNRKIIKHISILLELQSVEEKKLTKDTFAPIDVLDYIYSILHSMNYRTRYRDFLKIDFPIIPYPKRKESFWRLVKLGCKLRKHHLLENSVPDDYAVQYIEEETSVLSKLLYQNEKVHINNTNYFNNVPEKVWEFYIGGYQPAQKWLKDRKGRTLSKADVKHYQKIIVALSETIRIMKEIDEVIDEYGGWPDAFHNEPIDIAGDTGDPNQETLF